MNTELHSTILGVNYPWSLQILNPEACKYLDNNRTDHSSRLVFCDILEDNGYHKQAERWKWMANIKRCPHPYTLHQYGWFIFGLGSILMANECLPEWKDFINSKGSLACHHFQPTRQKAEDALIHYLLRFEENPFL